MSVRVRLHAGRSKRRRLGAATLALLLVSLAGSASVRADPPDALAPPNFLDYPTVGVPMPGEPVSLAVPATTGAAPVGVSCQWQDGGTGSVGAAWSDVSGATACSAYGVPAGLGGHWLRGRLTASNGVGSSSLFSDARRVGGDVVYLGPSAVGFGLWRMGSDGASPTQLRSGSFYSEPSISPDGQKLLYLFGPVGNQSEHEVYVANADGTNPVALTNFASGGPLHPRFSPDGTRIAYIAPGSPSGTLRVGTLNADRSAFASEQTLPVFYRPVNVDWFDDETLLVSAQAPDDRVFWHEVGCFSGEFTPPRYRVETVGGYPGCGSGWDSVEVELVAADDGALVGQLTQTDLIWDGFGGTGSPTRWCNCHTFDRVGVSAAGEVYTEVQTSNPNENYADYQPGTYHVDGGPPAGATAVPNTTGSPSIYRFDFAPAGEAMVAEQGSNVVRLNGDGSGLIVLRAGSHPAWGSLAESLPPLPSSQTWGDELAINPGDDADVNLATGSYSTSVTDLSLPGIDLPFEFTRSYNSFDTTVGDLGPGWQHPFAAKLTIAGNGDVTARASDAQQLLFIKQADGSYRPYAGGTAALSLSGGAYTLKTDVQSGYLFNSSGKLSAITTPKSVERRGRQRYPAARNRPGPFAIGREGIRAEKRSASTSTTLATARRRSSVTTAPTTACRNIGTMKGVIRVGRRRGCEYPTPTARYLMNIRDNHDLGANDQRCLSH